MAVVLITGGVRSGKSRHAEMRAGAYPGRPVYIATAEALDSEMAERIEKHRARRGNAWLVREVPLDLVPALLATDGGGARLIDCLTLWLSNLLHAERDWTRAVSELGIVPDNALARAYLDAAGQMNQTMAGVADNVEFMVAGLPMKLK